MLDDVEQVVEVYREELGQSLVGMALFGSASRGEARTDSDRDIFVLAQELPENVFERQMFLRSLLPRAVGTKVSVMAKTKDEFERKLLPVYLDIATDAVILYDPEGYLKKKFAQVKERLEEEGLVRKRIHNTWAWVWKESRGKDWELEWQ